MSPELFASLCRRAINKREAMRPRCESCGDLIERTEILKRKDPRNWLCDTCDGEINRGEIANCNVSFFGGGVGWSVESDRDAYVDTPEWHEQEGSWR